ERAQQLIEKGRYREALAIFARVLRDSLRQPQVWVHYGNMLKTLGRTADAIIAYREAIALRPAFGRAWWAISNLKTVRFEEDEVAAMRDALDRATGDDDRLHLGFALGKALDERGDY